MKSVGLVSLALRIPRPAFRGQAHFRCKSFIADQSDVKSEEISQPSRTLAKKSRLELEFIWKFQPDRREELLAMGFDPTPHDNATAGPAEKLVVADAASYRPSGPDRHTIITDLSNKEAWQYPTVPAGYWSNIDTHRRYFDWLGKRLNISSMDDWYRVTKQHFIENSGYGLLSSKYNSSVFLALKAVYPDHEWVPWLFSHAPKGYFAKLENQRQYFDWFAKRLKIEKMEQWYNVKQSDFAKFRGKTMLATHYGGNVEKALRAVYPSHEWHSWLFKQVPDGYWENAKNQRAFFDWLGKQLGVKELPDWQRFSAEDITRVGGWKIIGPIYGRNIRNALSSVYPEHDWSTASFQRESKS